MSDDTMDNNASFDVIVVGAGFAGLYTLHRLRKLGLSTRIYEAGDNVGGTWYWNRYPGARCDAESLAYSFGFDEELEQTWEWSERYSTQPEILKYAEHVAERFDLRKDIRFDRRVNHCHYNNDSNRWQVRTEAGDSANAQFLIMATGCLSAPLIPEIPGLDDFAGERYQASLWPHEGVDFSGKTVGIIGTGSSAIQAIPVIAEQAKHLTVFQRTPNFSVPANNYPLDQKWVAEFKEHYRDHRQLQKQGLEGGFGDLQIQARETPPVAESGRELTDEAFDAALEDRWQKGGAWFIATIADLMMDEETNRRVQHFVHRKIREIVTDPTTAADLCPTSHPIGTKRICVDSNYYETYNRDNVKLVNLRKTPIEKITPSGISLSDQDVNFDVLVLATGFDAMTGALLKMDIRGIDGQALADKWAAGPRTYLGLMMAGFPNLFTITGPGSPSVLSNMIISIEQHVDFIVECLEHASGQSANRIETSAEAEDQWVSHVNDIASATLFPRAGSWYMGANIPGKPQVFMPYAAGVGEYRLVCEDVALNNFRGFVFSQAN